MTGGSTPVAMLSGGFATLRPPATPGFTILKHILEEIPSVYVTRGFSRQPDVPDLVAPVVPGHRNQRAWYCKRRLLLL